MLGKRRCVVGLGANLGDRVATFESAVACLCGLGRVGAISHLYETTAVGGPPQPDYFNAAVLLLTDLGARPLLDALLEIEQQHGRVRTVRWGPRQLDLDLLWIEDTTVVEPNLTVPHARLTERGFALLPLVDVAPDAREPGTDRLYADMRGELSGPGIRLHGIARRWTDVWLTEPAGTRLWQFASLGL